MYTYTRITSPRPSCERCWRLCQILNGFLQKIPIQTSLSPPRHSHTRKFIHSYANSHQFEYSATMRGCEYSPNLCRRLEVEAATRGLSKLLQSSLVTQMLHSKKQIGLAGRGWGSTFRSSPWRRNEKRCWGEGMSTGNISNVTGKEKKLHFSALCLFYYWDHLRWHLF